MTVHALDRGRGLSPRRRRIVQAQFTLGDIVDAVMHFAADSREAEVVVEDLVATGRIRFEFLKGMSPDGWAVPDPSEERRRGRREANKVHKGGEERGRGAAFE